jgi:hypothetical protein
MIVGLPARHQVGVLLAFAAVATTVAVRQLRHVLTA